jgi:hypothetical protein
MTIEKRTPNKPNQGKMDQGIVLAKVVGYLDAAFMGGLEVTLLRQQGNTIGDINQTYPVKYASPFYGVTGYEYMGLNVKDFNDTQKSYGMWFPTPEIGTTVLCVFIEGNPGDGYWIGCIPGRFMNQMIPAIGGSKEVDLTDEDKKKYDTTQPLPVAEINRKANSLEKNLSVDKIKKAVHPIADRFLEQGLLEDDVRGTTTSTSRRNVPSSVFGISTPGPFDRRPLAKKSFIGKKQSLSSITVPVSRLGGTQLVFDDGDDRYERKTPAGKGPVDYADTTLGQKGDPTIPYNEYVRLRTRTGHQILLHNSEDLIYIGNARGTAWVELTSNGKIDIYAEDCISIHSEQDINLRADRDINIEGGRNVNIKAAADYSGGNSTDAKGFESGRVFIESKHDTKIVVGANGYITTAQNLNVSTGITNHFTAGANTNVLSGGTHFETASIIHMNGPAATPATPITSLKLHDNIRTSSKEKWNEKNRYVVKDPLKSILKRVPMHEPWAFHENQAPNFLTPSDTDREDGGS